jgi:uncharacterized protein YkwD
VRRLRLPLLTAALALLIAVPASAGAATKATECEGEDDPVTQENLATAERTLLCMVNVYRVENQLEPLTEDPALMRAARSHSEYMERTGLFDHKDIGDGAPSSRAEDAGFECGGFECVGENIARSNFPSTAPSEMMDGWKRSPGHDANMREPGYVTAGMGFALGGNNGLTGTQNFSGVSNGAEGTAADMLTNAACRAAESRVATTKDKVGAAKRKVKGADGKKEKRRAKAKLRRMKKKLAADRANAAAACDLTY